MPLLHSLLLAGSKLGLILRIASPKEYRPNHAILKAAEEAAEESDAIIEFYEDPYEAVKGVDVVYTDVWVSMGQEAEREAKISKLKPYQVNLDIIKAAGTSVLFMHCLPAHRGEEVTDEVIDGGWSIVWDQAENRLHTEKAMLSLLLH